MDARQLGHVGGRDSSSSRLKPRLLIAAVGDESLEVARGRGECHPSILVVYGITVPQARTPGTDTREKTWLIHRNLIGIPGTLES